MKSYPQYDQDGPDAIVERHTTLSRLGNGIVSSTVSRSMVELREDIKKRLPPLKSEERETKSEAA